MTGATSYAAAGDMHYRAVDLTLKAGARTLLCIRQKAV